MIDDNQEEGEEGRISPVGGGRSREERKAPEVHRDALDVPLAQNIWPN
jgi:hypothetical protein